MQWDFGISKELEMVEKKIINTITSEEPLLTDIASYVVGSGGKRIRPTVSLLSYKALGGTDIEMMTELSAAYELIHNATLIHDDINDGSSLRRGKVPAHKKFGIHRALVTGDYLFVKGFAIGGKFDSTVVDITAKACTTLAEGEIKQKNSKWKLDMTKEEYYDIISKKTARLIEAGAMVGAYLADGTMDEINALGEYALNLGMAFQIIDDVLDVVGNGDSLGKEIGTDLREGNVTITTIYALKELMGTDRDELIALLKKENMSLEDIEKALSIIKSTKAVENSRNDARMFSDKAKLALESLKRNDCRKEMIDLVDLVVERDR
jgi:octaprenyl-diphosphate synthase